MKNSHRIQEWLADRISWVQYPNIRPSDAVTREAGRTGLSFKWQMPPGQRIQLFLWSSVLLLIAIAATVVVLGFIYLFISALISV